MKAHFDLARWDTPFASSKNPSVSIISEEGGDIINLIISSAGVDTYPKYQIRFQKVIALLQYEEAFAFDRGYRSLTRDHEGCCSYIWKDSPWLKSYEKGSEVFAWKRLDHYLIFGGDSIVELIASELPDIQHIESPSCIITTYQA